jgi:3',5'-cyclic AMP phosphodiesterase CpdA
MIKNAVPASRALPFLAIVLLAAALAAQTTGSREPARDGEKVIGGPYVVNAGPKSATLMWVVQTGQALVGTQPDTVEHSVPALRAEKVEFNGLKPGMTYYYQAFPGEGGKGSFKTPPSGAAKFQFVVFGDTRTRHDVHRAVINSILKYASPDFVMHTGDLVENGGDTSLWPIFFDAERELLRKAAFFPSLGNHERNAARYYEYMDAKPYYSFNWGSAHFSVLDSDIDSVGASQAERDSFWQEETRWLQADLRDAAKADLRFVFAHHPPITAVKRRQGDNPHMTALEPMFEEYHVSAAFFGHDHNYQHYQKNGVQYFITGGGGAPLYDVDLPPPGITVKVEETENFVVVKVDGSKVHVEALRPNGETIDVANIGQ